MARARYSYHEPRTFGGYIDGDTGRTLHAEPGGVYDVLPGPAPAPWFTPLEGEPELEAAETPAEDIPPEPEPEAGENPGEPEPEQF